MNATAETIDFDTSCELTACPILHGLDAEYVALLAEGAQQKTYKSGEMLIHLGEPANRMFLIRKGKVVVEWHRPGHKNIVVDTAGPGQIVGVSWLFAPFISHFQARVVEPVEAVVVDGGHLLVTCEKNCELGYRLTQRLAQVLIERLQDAQKQLLGKSAGVPAEMREKAPASKSGSNLRELVAGHPFFHGFSNEHLAQIADCAMHVRFESNQLMFKGGDPANRLYLIVHGRVGLQWGESGYTQTIQVLNDGEAVGWSWLYEPYRWHFDARALEPTSAIFIYGTRLRELCEKDHCFGYQLLKRITRVVIQRLEAVCEVLAGSEAIDLDSIRLTQPGSDDKSHCCSGAAD